MFLLNILIPKNFYAQYKISDRLAVFFQSSDDAYIYIIHIGPTGDITHIFPNEYASDNFIKGGKQYTFPDENAPFEWILQEPGGTHIIKVIATKVPVDIRQFIDVQLSIQTSRNIQIIPKSHLPSDQWAEASCTVVVQSQEKRPSLR